MSDRVLVGLALFVGSMVGGWWLGRRKILNDRRANQLVRAIVKGVAPVVLCLSFWRMNLRSLEPWLLPVTGFLVSAATLIPAYLYSRRAKLTQPQTGSFLTCAFFSNIGYLGAYTAYALFGETAYALCILYLVFFTPSFYTLGFGIAEHYGHQAKHVRSRDALNDELRLYPFMGMLVGASLSLLRVPRPDFLQHINHVLINVDLVCNLMAAGSQLLLVSPRPWLKPCLAMCAIKFLFAPAVAWALVSFFHIEGLPRIVVLIEASTSVGVSPLMLPLLFGLDRRLSNALWIFTTAVAMPWLLIMIPVFQHM